MLVGDNEGGEVGGLKGSLSGRCIINDRQLFKRAVLSKIVCNQMRGVLAVLRLYATETEAVPFSA